MDTDSIIFIDDGSDECKKIQERLGACLGQLTNELGMNYITEFVAPAPKDYAYKLNDGTTKMKNKGIVCNAESERKITFEKKIELVKGQLRESIPIVNKLFVLDKKKNTISVKKQIKKYSMEFNKRMIPNGGNNNDTIISYPYGY